MDVILYTYVDKARCCIFQFGICHVRESSTFKRTTILYILERVRVVQCSCGYCINTLAHFCDGDEFANFLYELYILLVHVYNCIRSHNFCPPQLHCSLRNFIL